MSKWASLFGGNSTVATAASVIALGGVLVAGLVVTGLFNRDPSDPPVVVPAPVEVAAPAPQPAPAPVVEVVENTPKTRIAPAFDVVRLEPDGNTLIAGSGQPESTIMVLLDGDEIAEVVTDSSGKFVSFLSVAPSEKPRVLSLLMKDDGGDVVSPATVILAPFTAITPEVVAEISPETEAAPEVVPAPGIAPDQPLPEPVETVASQEPASPAVLMSDDSGVKVLQAPVAAGAGPEVMASVALESISYSETGDVQLSGRGKSEGFVRVYLDNKPVTSSRIASDGEWRMALPQVDTGVYTLRVDEVNAEGAVVSRVETPFKREEPAKVAAAQTVPALPQVQVITVQPGSTLWAIARESYGEGVLYVRVFEANRDRIRNPDLIYPGQVFTIPE